MKIILSRIVFTLLLVSLFLPVTGQEKDSLLSDKTFSGIKFRSIGPAFMSGRIADITIDPVDENTWDVAAGSEESGRRKIQAQPGNRFLTTRKFIPSAV